MDRYDVSFDRYADSDCQCLMEQDRSGQYVRYEDHIARVAELQSEKDELHELLEEVLPTAESYLYICPDRHGKTIALFARARQALAGKEGE